MWIQKIWRSIFLWNEVWPQRSLKVTRCHLKISKSSFSTIHLCCLSSTISTWISIHHQICLSVCLSVCLSIYLPTSLSIYILYLSTWSSIHHQICLSIVSHYLQYILKVSQTKTLSLQRSEDAFLFSEKKYLKNNNPCYILYNI